MELDGYHYLLITIIAILTITSLILYINTDKATTINIGEKLLIADTVCDSMNMQTGKLTIENNKYMVTCYNRSPYTEKQIEAI